MDAGSGGVSLPFDRSSSVRCPPRAGYSKSSDFVSPLFCSALPCFALLCQGVLFPSLSSFDDCCSMKTTIRRSIGPRSMPLSNNTRRPPGSGSRQVTLMEEDPLLDEDMHTGSDDCMEEEDDHADVASVAIIERGAKNRKKLIPVGDTFVNKTEVLGNIHNSIHAHFTGPWTSFSKVEDYDLKLWWGEFEDLYFWDAWDGPLIKANWRLKCSAHMRNAFNAARNANKKPKWISPENWAKMLSHWKKCPKFKKSSEVNKKNLASLGRDGTTIYTGGSKSAVQYAEEFLKDNCREMNPEELMLTAYHSKKKGEYIGDRTPKCVEHYKELRTSWLATHSKITKEEEHKLWIEAVGGESQGRIFGLGSTYRKWDYVMNPAAPPQAQALGPPLQPQALGPPPQQQALGPPPLDPSPLTPNDAPAMTESQMIQLVATMGAQYQALALKVQMMENEKAQGYRPAPPSPPPLEPEPSFQALMSAISLNPGGSTSTAQVDNLPRDYDAYDPPFHG